MIDMQEKIIALKKAVVEIEAQKKKIAEEIGYEPFLDAFKKTKEKFPELIRINWNQYTPYWNDGSECVFGVNELRYDIMIGDYEEEGEPGHNFLDYMPECSIKELKDKITIAEEQYQKKLASGERYAYNSSKYLKEQLSYFEKYGEVLGGLEGIAKKQAAVQEFVEFRNSIPDEIMLLIFGDHVEITIDDDGVEVEEYSHD